MTKPKKRGTGEALGAIIVGLDQQIFRTMPPPHELVLKASPVRGLSGERGELEITFPDDEGPVDTATDTVTDAAEPEVDPPPG